MISIEFAKKFLGALQAFNVPQYNSVSKHLEIGGTRVSFAAPEYTWSNKPLALDVPRGELIRVYDATTFSGTGYNPMGTLFESDGTYLRPFGEQILYANYARSDAPISTLTIPGSPPAESLYALSAGTFPVIPGSLMYPGMVLRTRIHIVNKATNNAASGANFIRWGNAAGLTDPYFANEGNTTTANVGVEMDFMIKCLAIGVNGVGSVISLFPTKNGSNLTNPPYLNNSASVDTTKSWTMTPSWANTNVGDARSTVGYTVSILPL